MTDRPAVDETRWQRAVDVLAMHEGLRASDPQMAERAWDAALRLIRRMNEEDDRRGLRESIPSRTAIRDYDYLMRIGYFADR